ncbi:allergen Tha p 1-like [Sitophilus oryzae]|uniref:Allergen Tha p 1-like n=1 Tax=Sitophilus oryzae TaxID=7048 RepID=A0A6J2Y5W9_SITOR|nr:allergen Tha p 1-like [Sitophilus oryzae]
MKYLAVFVLLCLCTLVWCKPQAKYTTRYDNVDLDAIIRSDRLLKNYVDCMVGRKKCTKDGEELKRNLPDALQTACSKCSEAQKAGSRKIIRHLITNRPQWFRELEVIYDPQGVYRRAYNEELKREKLTL